MVKRMLVDATHPEETRVVVLDGTRLEEFDVETSTKKQIKGNIYLAKVIRVEPSLQAAFVDYGGNRHGFLAFSEIHPDYYQIPVADRERLLAEQDRHEREEEERHAGRAPDADHHAEQPVPSADAPPTEVGEEPIGEHGDASAVAALEEPHPQDADAPHDDQEDPEDDEDHNSDTAATIPLSFIPPAIAADDVAEESDEHEDAAGEEDSSDGEQEEVVAADEGQNSPGADEAPPPAPGSEGIVSVEAEKPIIETIGGDDDVEEESAHDDGRRRRFVASRHYKIQEVIKRRQIMLVQVVKEERGNKGAALTTYLSLAGRYCVLMPNSARGGGVSRKITSAQDRRRLKTILGDLELPPNMGVILRTAGAERNKAEIKRDYEYLQRTWNSIREVTMSSRAPALIHEEASLIKRAIRDIYSRDIEEVWVEGEEGYKTAKDFMRMLTPSHAKKVQRYKDDIIPLFHRYQVETQMESINSPVVQLRSGGSIVFAQTEALVAIDVNSGRATRERHIEETAYKTNMEAAEEIARQLRLRDLAGLVVIDFIDMEDNRNNHAVERRLKEALKADRARIQVGRISHFGLLELSRQRLRPSLIEANFRSCPHCAGTGMIRSTESAAVHSLRMLEEEGVRQRSSEVTITVHPDVALYLLNYKRETLASIETRYGIKIFVLGDDTLIPPNLRLDRVKAMRAIGESQPIREIAPAHEVPAEPEAEAEDDDTVESDEEETHQSRESEDENGGRRRRRRRRRRRNGNGDERGDGQHQSARAPEEGSSSDQEDADEKTQAEGQGQDRTRDDHGRRRRRGRRGGRRRRRGNAEGGEPQDLANPTEAPRLQTSEEDQETTLPQSNDAGAAAEPADLETSPNEPEGNVQASMEAAGAEGPFDEERGTKRPSRFFRAIKEGMLGRRNDNGTAVPTEAPSSAGPPQDEPPTERPAIQEDTSAAAIEPEPTAPPRKGWWSGEKG